MSQPTTVHVSGISSATTDKEIHDFFSFCGKITSLKVTPESGESDSLKTASVTFEKEAAAKTAVLLDNTQLGPSTVHVAAAHSLDDIAGSKAVGEADVTDEHVDHIPQEDKPRSRIFAEYLAHGYALSDQALNKAIALDQKHGVSTKFTAALTNFDSKYHATDRVRGIDESYKISDKASTGWRGLHSYFEKALDTPSGRKLRDFYVKTDKQVRDIHEEARRLADLKKEKTDAAAVPAATSAETSERPAAAEAPAAAPPTTATEAAPVAASSTAPTGPAA